MLLFFFFHLNASQRKSFRVWFEIYSKRRKGGGGEKKGSKGKREGSQPWSLSGQRHLQEDGRVTAERNCIIFDCVREKVKVKWGLFTVGGDRGGNSGWSRDGFRLWSGGAIEEAKTEL